MRICKVGLYKDNVIVLSRPIMCYGGFGQPQCRYLSECRAEHIKSKPRATKGGIK